MLYKDVLEPKAEGLPVVSIAISLKRIADALEKEVQHKDLTRQLHAPQNPKSQDLP